MKQLHNLEIIFCTGTSFAKRELCKKNDPAMTTRPLADELEKACCSGLLFEMLPEVLHQRENIFVWKISQAEKHLKILLGETPRSIDYQASIDPDFFLPYTLLYC